MHGRASLPLSTILKGISVFICLSAARGHVGVGAMTILVIRKHKRFAVRHNVGLQRLDGPEQTALIFEVSLEGCRLAITRTSSFVTDQPVVVKIEGFGSRTARVRWTGPGFVGLRFDAAMHIAELDQLIHLCRDEAGNGEPLRAYAT